MVDFSRSAYPLVPNVASPSYTGSWVFPPYGLRPEGTFGETLLYSFLKVYIFDLDKAAGILSIIVREMVPQMENIHECSSKSL
jgi:hypothetical protein